MAEPDPEPDAWCDDVVDTEGDGGTLSVLKVWERCMRGGIDVEVVMGEERLVEKGGRAGGLWGISIVYVIIEET